jgi:hypothetical protein
MGAALRARAAGLSALLLSVACSKRPDPADEAAGLKRAEQSIASARAEHDAHASVPERDAREVLAVVRATWPLIWSPKNAVDEAKCHDETIGLENLRTCIATALADADARKAKLIPQGIAKLECSKQVEAAARRYVAERPGWLKKNLAWLDDSASKLRGLMRTRSLSKVADLPGDLTADEPFEPLDASQAAVNGIRCTGDLFTCAGFLAGTCPTYVIARAMHLEPIGPMGTWRVTMRATSSEVTPSSP